MNQATNTPRWEKFALLALLVVGICARLYWFCYNPSLWNDEAALANNIIRYDAQKLVVTPLDDLQAAPPGFLLMEKIFGKLGDYSERSLRLFPLLCGIAALLLFFSLAKQLLAGAGRVVAVALFSLSGPLIFHSGDAKQYETEALAAVLLLWLAVRLRVKLNLAQAIGAGMVGMVCIVTANSAVFVLAGAFGMLAANFLVKKQWRNAVGAGVVLALSLSAFLLYYAFILRKNPNVAALKLTWAEHFAPLPVSRSGLVWYARTTFFALGNPLGLSLDLDLPFLPHSTGVKYLLTLSYPGLILFAAGTVIFLRKNFYAAAIVLSGLLLTLLASLLHQYPLNERLILFFAPAVYLAIGRAAEWATASGSSGHWRTVSRWLVALLLAYPLVNFAAKMAEPRLLGGEERYSQMREAIQFIAQKKQPGDAVYVMWSAARFYEYYNYREHLDWKVIPGTDPRIDANSETAVGAEVERQIRQSEAGQPRTWFLLQSIMSPVRYQDDNGVKHETLTPTGVLYENALLGKDQAAPAQTFTGPAASAYLVTHDN